MNEVTGQKDVVLNQLRQLINAFQQDTPAVKQAMNSSLRPTSEAARQAMRAQIVQQLQQAYATEQNNPHPEPWYAPQNSVIGLVQSAMDQQLGPKTARSPPATADAVAATPNVRIGSPRRLIIWKKSFRFHSPFRPCLIKALGN